MARRKRNKYGNKKTVVNGITFDSKAEARRYCELRLLERAGEISNLELQPKFVLIPKHKRRGRTVRQATYKADFRYVDEDGNTIVEDVKGVETREFKLKRKLLEFQNPDLIFEVVTA